MIGRGAVRLHQVDGGEIAVAVGTPSVDVPGGRGAVIEGIVNVGRKRQVVAQRADIARGGAEALAELPLDGEVELVALGPLEIEVDGKQSGREDEAPGGG